MKTSMGDKSGPIYQVGPWFLHVNRHTRVCELTSGDLWYIISRAEAATRLRDSRRKS